MHSVQFLITWSLHDHMIFLHRKFLHSRHRWKCGYCSLHEKHSIFGFVFWCWIYSPKPVWLHIYYKTCSEGRITHFFCYGIPLWNIHIITDMKERRPVQSHTLIVRPTHWVGLSTPTNIPPYFHGDVIDSLTLPTLTPWSLFCQPAIRVGWAGPAGTALCLTQRSLVDDAHQMWLQMVWHEQSPSHVPGC